jgi:hypothetical protein
MIALKRVLRYLKGRPTLPYIVAPDGPPTRLDTYCDADWASDTKSRRSTSGAIVTMSGAVLHHYSRTQPTVALSSTESELSSCVTAVSETLFLQTVLEEMGYKVSVHVHCDSRACLDHLNKLGLGRLKHIGIKACFLQELLSRKLVHFHKVLGTDNVSDVLTKAVDVTTLERLLRSKLIKLDVSESKGNACKFDSDEPSEDVRALRCILTSLVDNCKYCVI